MLLRCLEEAIVVLKERVPLGAGIHKPRTLALEELVLIQCFRTGTDPPNPNPDAGTAHTNPVQRTGTAPPNPNLGTGAATPALSAELQEMNARFSATRQRAREAGLLSTPP